MGRKKKRKKYKRDFRRESFLSRFTLPEEIQQKIWGILLILLALIIGLSFFNKAGSAGDIFMEGARFLIGNTIFASPLVLILAGLVFLLRRYDFDEKKISWPIVLAVFILILGITGLLAIFSPLKMQGGWLGYMISWPFMKYFGFWASLFIFLAPIFIGGLIFWQFLRPVGQPREEVKINSQGIPEKLVPERSSIVKKIFAPKFKVKEISSTGSSEAKMEEKTAPLLKLETKSESGKKVFAYQPPPTNLLEKERGVPTSGDTRVNSSIIKKTLQNFNIEVAMSEINIGPTVTQYTFKPAEGVKLSKITSLSNDLSLALASHPIRIEAPIPGRSLVGIELPNKVRAQVRLRNLIENPSFQKSSASLMIPLGRDVSGFPVYADLTKMPHLLVAGSTGTGKTIFLNNLITSLLYQPSTFSKSASPEMLRFILVDPKRVEFPVYSNLPHLLCPVIYNASQTINALRWLTGEMERRFDVLKEAQKRDIGGFNEEALEKGTEPLPFIILVIDELADLMAAKGREIEAGIVRLAQMARAVGIHLIVATQRPSVEVITGLIKANITSRVTFQVASQVDSRTVLDSSGAEKLLGGGDLLFISAQVPKPKRIQGPYVSDKEVKRAVNYINPKEGIDSKSRMSQELVQELDRGLGETEGRGVSFGGGEDEPLYEEAKRLVIESNRASASLLQRRLRLGYARAARLIDMLEEEGIVGPAEGSKPREVYGNQEKDLKEEPKIPIPEEQEIKEDQDDWEKI